jgi:acetyl-CoA decarbonylase/synthase, CODH/ACS complex subunit delta
MAERIEGQDKTRDRVQDLLALLAGTDRIELERFSMEVGDLEFWIPSGNGVHQPAGRALAQAIKPKPSVLYKESYTPPVENFPCSIHEVRLGATKKDGGSRRCSFTIGGSNSPPFAYADKPPRNLPVFAMDVFDTNLPMPMAVKAGIHDVMDDPAEWAKRNVNKFGADMVTVHLVSTDPLAQDSSPADAARTIERVLQAVDVPIIIGGCGDPKKDSAVFARVSEVASGERLLLNSVTLDMATANVLEPIAKAAKQHGHALIGLTGLELNKAKELNRRLFEYLPPEDIVMDLTTVALGYGLEYSFTIHERARYSALMGDDELRQPTISAASNSWVAREARQKMDPQFGPREIRGPLWETINAITLLLAGVDIFMVAHPTTLTTLKDIVQILIRKDDEVKANTAWCGARI